METATSHFGELAAPYLGRSAMETERARRNRQIVDQFEEAVRGKESGPFNTAEFCKSVGASEPTVRRAVLAIHDVGPNRYLQLLRLKEVRRLLSSDTDGHETITQIAGRFGFHELGRFAREYGMAFGERPSETLRRARAVRLPSTSDDQTEIAATPPSTSK